MMITITIIVLYIFGPWATCLRSDPRCGRFPSPPLERNPGMSAAGHLAEVEEVLAPRLRSPHRRDVEVVDLSLHEIARALSGLPVGEVRIVVQAP